MSGSRFIWINFEPPLHLAPTWCVGRHQAIALWNLNGFLYFMPPVTDEREREKQSEMEIAKREMRDTERMMEG